MEGIEGKEGWGGLGWWEKAARAARNRWVESRVGVLVTDEEEEEEAMGDWTWMSRGKHCLEF